MSEDLEIYLRVREREGRLYSDDVVRQLPEIPVGYSLFAEWQVRAVSCRRLLGYLSSAQKPLTILELGCGNGWLSNRLASVARGLVVGLDREGPELRQANRVFAHRHELAWVSADILHGGFSKGSFDAVVIASAVQYFPDVPRLIQALRGILKKDGEIHILDSPFYAAEEVSAARERSRSYYERLGFPEMAAYYHHHSASVLEAYNPVWLYRPSAQLKDSPFPWIRLRPWPPSMAL
jgi:ubiquinone/menaquinone biosynthesis C-methylase UbiE